VACPVPATSSPIRWFHTCGKWHLSTLGKHLFTERSLIIPSPFSYRSLI
jgi:hypothetical protein